jgi:hypothetical protein
MITRLVRSSLWHEPHAVIRVLMALIATMDRKTGICQESTPGIANLSRTTLAEAEAALVHLSSPDRFSEILSRAGRRIEPLPGVGWQIHEHTHYLTPTVQEVKRMLWREARAKRRAKGTVKRWRRRKAPQTPP